MEINTEVSLKCNDHSVSANTPNTGKVFVEMPPTKEGCMNKHAVKGNNINNTPMAMDTNGDQGTQEFGLDHSPKENSNIVGKLTVNSYNNHDHNKPDNLHNSKNQNEHEKGSNVQVDGKAPARRNINIGKTTTETRIPPPIKVSSNFHTYKPNHPKSNQICPKKNQTQKPTTTTQTSY